MKLEPHELNKRHEQLDRLNQTGNEVYLFFSVDLVNSTQFKNQYPKDWPSVFGRFYDVTEELMTQAYSFESERVSLWKRNGDEVLFQRKVSVLSDIVEAPKWFMNIMRRMKVQFETDNPEIAKKLSFKGAIFLADVHNEIELSDSSEDVDNIKVKAPKLSVSVPVENGSEEVQSSTRYAAGFADFLGSDIDAGFRLAKYAPREKMVVDPKIAYLVYKQLSAVNASDGELSKFKIMGFKQLKGVWGSLPFPIIWYIPDIDKGSAAFSYRDRHLDEFISDYLHHPNSPLRQIEHIVDVHQEVNTFKEKVQKIEQTLERTSL